MAEKTNLGNDRNGIPDNMNVSRCGLDPPKNVSGTTGIDLWDDLR
jgi:hypothetical protein